CYLSLSSTYAVCARRVAYAFPTRRSSDLVAIAYPLVARNRLTSESLRYVEGDALYDGVVRVEEDHAQTVLIRSDADRTTDALERSEEHTSELQSRENLVCRLLLA